MKFGLYCIKDTLAGSYGEPFCAQTPALAQRRFQYLADNSPMVCTDLQLYKIGEYDTDTGEIMPCVEFVCNYQKAVN